MYINREYTPRRRRKGFFARFWPLFVIAAIAIFFYETRPQWAFTAPIIPTATPTPSAVIYLTTAQNAVAEGKYDEALAAYKKAAELEPNNPQPLTQLSRLYLIIEGNYSTVRAFSYAEAALEVAPKDPQALTALARVFDWQNELQDAVDTALDSLDLDPNSAETLAVLGEIYNDAGNPTIAQDYINKALAIDPNHTLALRNQAKLFERAADYQRAVQTYDQAIAAAPNRFDIYIEKALQLRDGLGDFTGSNDVLKQATLVYTSPVTLNAYGYGLYVAGDHAQAVRELRKAVELDPEFGPAQVNLGRALAARLNFEDAVVAFEKGIKLVGVEKVSFDNLLLFGQSLMIQKIPDCERARIWFSEALKKDPTSGSATLGLRETESCSVATPTPAPSSG